MNSTMEEVETKLCENCKREIPTVNFTIHSVHCARNIRVCPVCKEPVLYAELKEHHEKLHKLQPCKKCGESVCGTDLEDHIRDSCGHTIRSCRYCELELPRRDLPAHENYCGVRTEQCPDCREWVMIKYRQLHLESNHGFIRLDDDPAPAPKKDPPKNAAKPINTRVYQPNQNTNPGTGNTNIPYTGNDGFARPSTSGGVSRTTTTAKLNIEYSPASTSNANNGFSRPTGLNIEITGATKSKNGLTPPTPDQISISIASRDVATKSAAGTPKNTPGTPKAAPQTPKTAEAPKTATDGPWVPRDGAWVDPEAPWTDPQAPFTDSGATSVNSGCNCRGAVKKRPAPKPPLRSPPPAPTRDMPYYSALQRQQQEERARQEQTAYNLSVGLPPVLSPAAKLDKLRKMDALQNPESFIDYRNRVRGRMGRQPDLPYPSSPCTCYPETLASEDPERRRQEFKNLKPMTPQEFLERFTEMQLKEDEPRQKNGEGEARRRSGDRFSEIKSSLRELRRGLNEVTAPYHANPNGGANANNNNNNNGNERAGPAFPRNEVVDLPCEFCNCLIPAHNLVQHQTGCRPDLAQLRPRSPSPVGAGALPHAPLPEPVIPCEFCARSLPLYLISEHQERCGREANLLYPD